MSISEIKHRAYKQVTSNFGTVFSISILMYVFYMLNNYLATVNTKFKITKKSFELVNNSAGSTLSQWMVSIIFILLLTGVSLSFVANNNKLNNNSFIFFKNFELFTKASFIIILTIIAISFGIVFFIIPGIIFALMFSQAIYLLADDYLNNRQLQSVFNYLTKSQQLMVGNKMKYFLLNLSLLGWVILSMIPFVFVFTLPYFAFVKMSFFNYLLQSQNNKLNNNNQ